MNTNKRQFCSPVLVFIGVHSWLESHAKSRSHNLGGSAGTCSRDGAQGHLVTAWNEGPMRPLRQGSFLFSCLCPLRCFLDSRAHDLTRRR
jgi:hypothetical protein